MNNPWFSKIAVWMVIAMVLFTLFKQFDNRGVAGANAVGYSDFLEEVRSNRIKSATISESPGGTEIIAITNDDRRIKTTATYLDRGLVGDLISSGVKFDVKPREEGSLLMTLLVSWGPMLLLIGVWVYFMRQMQGGGKGGAFSFGKSKARMMDENNNNTTFADVAGCDEAKEEVKEVVDFLKDPQRFQKLGGRIPRGLLLVGPPGTGKTLLAKGIAGEAKVPFFSISGSDFVEMFVGVGASRVRDMFENAKKNAPCIIFIDEIDAVGRQRGAGLGGGNDEREQTLNQMLVEMDGFDVSSGVILIAATNRPDILDPALLRPGRFDRQIAVDRPDLEGRYAILQVHARGKPLAEGVDLRAVARRTPGFTGADLANVLNEAALLTARMGGQLIDDDALDEAIDRVIAGPQKRTRVMDEQEKMITAYHEGGHALVAAALPGGDPVHKITIMPRGRALGYTMVLPDQEKYSTTRSQMLNQLAYMLGGRAAEELIFHDPTTGASNDIEKATGLARAMVTQFGMTERLGAIRYGQEQGEVFLGRDMGHARDYSEEVAGAIDEEVRSLIETAHQEAYEILVNNRDILDRLVLELLEKETLDKAEVEAVFADLRLRSPRPAWTGSTLRQPDVRGPVVAPANGSSNGTAHGHANGHAPAPSPAEGVVQRSEEQA